MRKDRLSQYKQYKLIELYGQLRLPQTEHTYQKELVPPGPTPQAVDLFIFLEKQKR